IQKIDEYIKGMSFEDFMKDTKTVDAVIRNFEVIGEASKNISQEIKDKYSDIPWLEMYLLRNKVSHEYFGIDHEIIWDVIKNYLPKNMEQITEIAKKER
ncbi:MAG: DUF86 domain-containing protein, partial [Candidatus Delongbacteria bacterium]|nr:DUF86 domain-containing protein [Candidatus Delongbacteria bacterium]MCG2760705.1 DUF86 domain-containing protein [Candidatus Delongbacteria bacterium]